MPYIAAAQRFANVSRMPMNASLRIRAAALALAALVLAGLGAGCSAPAPALVAPSAPALTLRLHDGLGTNASAITHDAASGRYYSVVAGNPAFPLAVHAPDGTLLAAGEAGLDARGLWWNARAGRLEAHGHGSGLYTFILDEDGRVAEVRPTGDFAVPAQAPGGAVGAYLPAEDALAFLEGDAVVVVGRDGEVRRRVRLALPVAAADLNPSGVVYTGVRGRELAALNPSARAVYFFDARSGALAQTLSLPPSAPRPMERFGFGFAGGYVWLYDTGARAWTGYRVVR